MRILREPRAEAGSAPSAPAASSPVDPASLIASVAAELATQANAADPTPANLNLPVPPEGNPAAPASASPAGATGTPPAGQAPASAPAPAADPDDAEPSAEVLVTLSDSGKRALQAEREKRKTARAEAQALRAELEALKAKTPASDPYAVAGSAPDPATAAQLPSLPAPSAAPRPATLAQCQTSAEVDAFTMQAIQRHALASELNTVLATEGLEAVVTKLTSDGVTEFRGKPLAELTAGYVAQQLAQDVLAAEQVKLFAPQQKQFLDQQRASMSEALRLMPELSDPKSKQRQQFNSMVNRTPQLRTLGADWPVLVVQQLLGMEAAATRTATTSRPPAAAPLTPAPAPATAPAPGAPRSVPATARSNSELEEISSRIKSGQASNKDMNRYAALQMQ